MTRTFLVSDHRTDPTYLLQSSQTWQRAFHDEMLHLQDSHSISPVRWLEIINRLRQH